MHCTSFFLRFIFFCARGSYLGGGPLEPLEEELLLEDEEAAGAVRGSRRPGGLAAAETSESVDWQNFGKRLLVFGCIGSDFCKKICVLQHFSKF